MKKNIVVGVMGAIVIAGVAFYSGMMYAQMSRSGSGGGNFENLSSEERQTRFFANGNPTGTRGPGGTSGGFAAGEVISRDETSITIKMQDGSTKLILVGSSTEITKSATGSSDDLATGINVVVTGTANSDGSLTAESVQIRPLGVVPFGGAVRTNE